MSSEIAISVQGLSKCYHVYEKPHDRLKQYIVPRLQGAVGLQRKQYFREYWALKDVSFEIRKGETVGIVGRNGSGKSTLLQMICNTLNPTGGSITTHGRVAALLELGSGFNPEFTGRENVFLNAAVLGLTEEQTRARFADIVAFADIGDFIEQPVKTYSSGMMLRLAFAVIAHVDADVLVVDEALSVGDAFFTQKCMRFLRSFMERGTILFVSHDTASVMSLCNRAIWLEQGQVQEEGSPKEICEKYLEAFYEAQQGRGTTTRMKPRRQAEGPSQDQRRDFINATNLRNDIELFGFREDAPSFGKGGASLCSVQLLDAEDAPLAWVVGGESVVLQVEVQAETRLDSAIVGFFVRDRLGQNLFGDNTWLTCLEEPVTCEPGQRLRARFAFDMPRLPPGDYSVTVAVADGSPDEHVQHHWMHDAVVFKSHSTSVSSGLIGIPMRSIELGVEHAFV
jgi:lipopolysaccharide transport system ATP-binding protein